MIEVKCINFDFESIININSIKSFNLIDNYRLVIELNDGTTITPSIIFTPTSKEIPDSHHEELLYGYFAERFKIVNNNTQRENDNLKINSKFKLQFDEIESVNIIDNIITYIEDDMNFSYKLTGSFVDIKQPHLTHPYNTESNGRC